MRLRPNKYARMNAMTPIVQELRPIRTLRETAHLMALTYQAVWQIERAALWKVKHRLQEQLLEP